MASEANVRSSLIIAIPANNLKYQSNPTDFQENVSVANGPSPGAVSVSVTGTNIDLSQLSHPGLCYVQNLEDASVAPNNFVTLGVYDGASFFPLIEVRPGKGYVFRLSRYLNEEFIGTGTNSDANQLRAVANERACILKFEAFDD